MRIESGPARVVHQGTVTSFFGSPLVFHLPLSSGDSLEVVLEFVDGDTPHVNTTLETHRVVLECRGFADGRGSAEPVLLHDAGSDLIWLHFRVFRHGQTVDHTVHVTFFASDKDAVGWTPRGAR